MRLHTSLKSRIFLILSIALLLVQRLLKQDQSLASIRGFIES